MRRVFGVGITLFALAWPAMASRDIRVVLDLSQSMEKNDRNQLALLSTTLLHDLAKPNPSMGDSFVVLPFDKDWRWPKADAAPPISRRTRIEAQTGKRDAFVKAIQALPYDAQMTYFYPGIAAALQDLEQRPAQAERTIVLITDGVPEKDTRDEELRRIRQQLGPRLEQRGIRLYVLAFGSEASGNRSFFDEMVRSPKGTSVGDVFLDPNGTQLLSYMLQIFERSFGFTPDTARPLPGVTTLDLQRNEKPEHVAVVVMVPRAQPPTLRMRSPSGAPVSAPEGVQSASAKNDSYSVTWVVRPEAGNHAFDSDANAGTVAVLRPTAVTIEVRPAPPLDQTERTLAATPFPLRVLVRSSIGKGDPGPVALTFRTFGDRTPTGYAWQSDPSGPAPGAFRVTDEGREYDITAEFRVHPELPDAPYVGYLEVEARRAEAVVGALAGQHAHRVEVHPLLALSPFPDRAQTGHALAWREETCTSFGFHLDAGQLPHPDRSSYPIRAVLTAPDPSVLDRELRQATFRLDGLPLEIEGKPGPDPGAWYKSRSLSGTDLLAQHELCMRIGRPVGGDPSTPPQLTLVTTLLENPYDDFHVIRPFQLEILVAPPTLLKRWALALFSAFSALSIFAIIWYLRDRPVLPADLGYAIAREDSTGPLASRPFDEPSAAAGILGRVAERKVIAPGEDRVLGRVRAVDE
ncbi:MAG: VWA domain-containing protein, partial [Acidobacteria bacterium]|nr:VWA domain-containing protein [Acidobacteriota bacterium]